MNAKRSDKAKQITIKALPSTYLDPRLAKDVISILLSDYACNKQVDDKRLFSHATSRKKT